MKPDSRNFHKPGFGRGALRLLPLVMLAFATTADAAVASPRVLQVAVQTPNPCWNIHITGVYTTPQELIVVSKLDAPAADAACAHVLSMAKDEVSVDVPDLPVRYIVFGRTWGWQPEGTGQPPPGIYIYPTSPDEVSGWLAGARKVK